mmetsp:Transcript_27298/g.49421  ORF Transcript_27298/g.49421 Transcript_27298/m.49421 type:complete len:300 (+) Transcript_27298:56-955(+)|eukprot:CAMPEP_0197623340 /NCGR_PEP_ID=MMETSP1338-20131121/3377_1 /TAXON_ID=43686 ORGANISM="Pelagodinium beii, Strain RCC1491" /NCGR_SAMPLE_ID=MMETSP1338 /ASSEMBLY_ACC=CAM_ASM_000754 /LENGTH=299 /DNA_ID=CAMNT_0043193281 /DNA_START=56 /DNA_END=955 /DNA_ORIENTATION=+
MALNTSTFSGLPTLLRQASASMPAKGRPDTAATSVADHKRHAPFASSPSTLTLSVRHRPVSASAIRRPGPAATFGKGPGHEGLYKSSISPGPSDYSKQQRPATRGGNYFTAGDRDRERNRNGLAGEERRQFRQLDQDHNGVLDFDEACKLFRRGNQNVQDVEVKALFDAIDVSQDGKIQFQELHEFLFSWSNKRSAWRSRLRAALNLNEPGPGDYSGNSVALSSQRRSGKAILGTGPGHDLSGFRPKTPGPATYSVKYSAVLTHAPRASFGKGPGHRDLATTSYDSFWSCNRGASALMR